MAILKDLYFGCADGDTESNKKEFLDLFYTGNNKYDEITNDSMKFIIYGKKGTGKTILGRYIEKKYNKQKINCRIFNKDDITLAKMIEKNGEELSGDEAIQLFKWIIYEKIYKVIKNKSIKSSIGISKETLNKRKKTKECNKAILELKEIFNSRYTQDNYELSQYIMNDEVATTGEVSVQKKSFIPKFIRSKKKSINKTYTKSEFYKLIERVEELILTCLKVISVVIILDDLDELDIDLDSNRNSAVALNKLIEAMKSVNILFANKELSPSKCILLIRSDMIEELNKRSTNLNKVIQDNSVELYWIDKDNNHPEKHMIMSMILNKVKKSCSEYNNFSDIELYSNLFPEKINNNNVVTYLINNSFGRPRDIICYLETIKRRYPNENKFRATMFRECKQSYSDAFLKELYNEAKIHIDLETLEEYLKLIRDYGKNSFYASHLKSYYKPRRKIYKKSIDINECLETLYKLGVLGNLRKTCKEEIIYSWGYRKDGNPNANLELKFTVHYGLRNILNTK
ncbi:MAG: hypothetical protein E6940_12395 [Clostridium septicum]|uniref:P-loop ATPase, Sll1717 family n=1 Tax=Clostridium septicum TaxID=1504 RepID=UPI00258BDC86|nr:hypothetical protein [Clostridium septicum]MDU1314842.1 hypothetical protein [Clostridium septicum]